MYTHCSASEFQIKKNDNPKNQTIVATYSSHSLIVSNDWTSMELIWTTGRSYSLKTNTISKLLRLNCHKRKPRVLEIRFSGANLPEHVQNKQFRHLPKTKQRTEDQKLPPMHAQWVAKKRLIDLAHHEIQDRDKAYQIPYQRQVSLQIPQPI